jgi:hypothetical protein
MEWILFVSLQWIALGSPTNPTTQEIGGFASEEVCNQAAAAIKAEISTPIGPQRAQTLGRIVCIERDSKSEPK